MAVAALAAAFFFTPPGEAVLQRQLEAQLGALFAGKVRAEALELSLHRIVLRNVRVETPEGEEALVVERVEATLRRWHQLELLAGRLSLESLQLQGAKVTLRDEGRGFGLARAFSARAPETPAPTGGSAPAAAFHVDVQHVTLAEGELLVVLPGGQRYAARAMGLEGAAALDTSPFKLKATARVTGHLETPTRAPLVFRGEWRDEGKRHEVAAELAVGEGRLTAEALFDDDGNGQVRLAQLELPPELARALLPGWPLLAKLSATGTGQLQVGILRADLEARAERAHLSAKGHLDFGRWHSDGIDVRLRDVDLAQLFEGAPKSNLAAELHAEGGGLSLDTLSGTLRLKAPAATVKGATWGPLDIDATASRGQVDIPRLAIALPGASLQAAGKLDKERRLELSGQLRATDLAQVGTQLSLLTGSAVPLAGSGALDVSARGHLAHLALSAQGTFPRLVVGPLSIQGLALQGRLPDLQKPLEAQGELSARSVALGGRRFEALLARLSTQGRRLTAELSAKGLGDMSLQAQGLLEKGGEGLLLSVLAVRYAGADGPVEWNLDAPFRFGWSGTDWSLEPMRLSSGPMSLSASGSKQEQRLRGGLDLLALDLRRLPKALVDPELGLGGRAEAHLSLDGRLARPNASGRLRWVDGAFGGIRGIGLSADGTYRNGQLSGRARAALPFGRLSADADLSLDRPAEPLRARVELEALELGEAQRALPAGAKAALPAVLQAGDWEGTLSARAELSGSRADPEGTLTVSGSSLGLREPSGPRWTVEGLEARLGATRARGLELRADLSAWGGNTHLEAQSNAALGQLWARRTELLEALARSTVSLSGQSEVQLSALYSAGLTASPVDGRLRLELTGRSAARSPEGNAVLRVDHFRMGTLPPTDLSLEVSAQGGGLAWKGDARRATATLLQVAGTLGLPLAELSNLAALGQAALQLEATTPGLSLPELLAVTRASATSTQAPGLEGTVKARATASGSLASPRLSLRADFDGLRRGGLSFGAAEVSLEHQKGRSQATANLKAGSGGQLSARAWLQHTLALLPTRQRSTGEPSRSVLGLEGAALEASLQSRALDLGFLSGIHPLVRNLGGKLDADLTAKGALPLPDLRGSAEWKGGVLGIEEYGEYRDIHLRLTGDREALRIEELVVRNGAGRGSLTGMARKSGSGSWSLEANAELERFPIISGDQRVATTSLKGQVRGEASATLVNLEEVLLSNVSVTLPQVAQRDLQELERPADIVLVKGGQPIEPDTRQARRAARVAGTGTTQAADSASKAQAGPSFELRAAVQVPGGVLLRGPDIPDAQLGVEDLRIVVGQEVELRGRIVARRGTVEVMGRRFTVQPDSEVRFAGPFKESYVKLTAAHQNEREKVTVFVGLTGRGKDLTLKTWSQPPLPEADIYTLLATGRRDLRLGSGTITGAQAASMVGSFFANQLKSVLAKKLPLDIVLDIKPGEEGFSKTRIEAGTYMSNQGLYVGYSAQVDADASKGENSHEVKVDYQISPRWSVEASFGNALTGGADLVWTREY